MSATQKRKGDSWESLAEKGKFGAAVKLLDQRINKHPNGGSYYGERAMLHMYLGNAQLARADIEASVRTDTIQQHSKPGRLDSDDDYNQIGVTYWMQGHRELALAFWRYTTGLLYAGRVSYSQMGGGIEAGVYLWFGAAHERRKDDLELIRKLYENRLASTFWSHDLSRWPGPVVQFYLGRMSAETMFELAARDDANLCEAHVAAALRLRQEGRYAAYRDHLRRAYPDPFPWSKVAFAALWPMCFLVKHEVQQW